MAGGRAWPSVAHDTTASRAHAYISLPLFLYPFFTLSLSLYRKMVVVSSNGGFSARFRRFGSC
nr:MAG TPA: hypothetical protein [Caudoviricetes sp.]